MGFAALIVAGSALLRLPIASANAPLSAIDALFISTSAVCVTGLSTIDIGRDLSGFGQTIVLILLQAGGLGIMMLGTLLVFVFGRRVSISLRDAASRMFLSPGLRWKRMLWIAIGLTAGIELAGAAILFARWLGEFGAARALWLAVFHAVSAFCNTGFSLFSDSLERFAHDPVVNIAVMALIVAGGLGFFSTIEILLFLSARRGKRRDPLSLHTKMVLAMTAALIVLPAIGIFLIERPRNLADATPFQAAMCALFQSVTARTAGFNTLPIAHLSNASLCVLLALMFVGGAPGSMAGGIKVTTAGALLASVWSRLRGMESPGLFGRSIAPRDAERAGALALVSMTFVFLVSGLLFVMELGDTPHDQSRGMFLDLLFETVSAFGTVGLSMGATPNLSSGGKLTIVITMFVGRLGPMALAYSLLSAMRKRSFHYPAEEIMIG
ncbi:MAG: Ktr system potassium uptake protein B [candidate division BRC1 bacterium ADurb.BinA364]|nr:MAG: Ktr system potassium uptake protein B [candidate division BRC1 bacterium ADurb.BinA364]